MAVAKKHARAVRPRAAGYTATPIVGIGASAGGLEAIEQFLGAVPARSGYAYIVVQHLDPLRPSALPEILQRATSIPVAEATHGTLVIPDAVYVIPPGKEVTVAAGRLRLTRSEKHGGLRLPIDALFKSLALEAKEHAIGVVLSGMGADGTLGLRDIKNAGGRGFAQLPQSAKFDSMPASVIDAGLADEVARPAALPAVIRSSGKHPVRRSGSIGAAATEDDKALRKILDLIRGEVGRDFSGYKINTIARRLERRVAARKLVSLADYAAVVETDAEERRALSDALLIGVTSFFRDPEAWSQLSSRILPALFTALPAGAPFRAWVPGCSTGEEAYTLAIVLTEAVERAGCSDHQIRIFATDLDAAAIDLARQGAFPLSIADSVSPERLARFFSREAGEYRVIKAIRERIVFAPHDAIRDPSFTKLQLLTCRNLMIYLTSEVQQKLVKLFHYSLEQDGVLLLGSSEAIPPAHDGFAPIDASLRLYRRLGAARNLTMASIEPTTRILPGAEHRRAVPKPHEPEDTSILPIIRQITPPAMILDRSGVEILRTFGRTGQFLAPVSRVSASTLPRAARAARAATRQPLAEVLRALARGRASSICEGLPNRRTRSIIRVTARRLRSPSSSRGQILVTFERLKLGKLTATNSTAEQRLTRALRRSEREVLALRQETLLSGEHLSAANEELQVVNEELQSANEELTTSKEETQSMNEELRSVNAELQSKLDNFSVVNSDLRNLLDSTDLAIVFLDSRLRIRRFTRQMAQVIRLIPGDVGRPVTDVKWDLVYPELAADIAEVLTTLVICEKEIRAAGNRWYALRILPYRTAENVIDGVVMTLADISKAKELEATLRAVASKPQSGSVDPSEA